MHRYRRNLMTAKVITALLLTLMAASPAVSQTVTSGYNYAEVGSTGSDALIFGFATYKICQIKTFLFALVYICAAIAFVIYAIKSLFIKFEAKQFMMIVAALFIVSTADLLVSFFTSSAYFCPTVFSSF